jgi:hypothetical protein
VTADAPCDEPDALPECLYCHVVDVQPTENVAREDGGWRPGRGPKRIVAAALNIKRQGILKFKAEGLSVSAHRGLRQSDVSPVAAA